MAARELVRAEAANIRRHARVAEIKKQALSLMPITDDPRDLLNLSTVNKLKHAKRPRAVLVFSAKHTRLLQACMCLRAPLRIGIQRDVGNSRRTKIGFRHAQQTACIRAGSTPLRLLEVAPWREDGDAAQSFLRRHTHRDQAQDSSPTWRVSATAGGPTGGERAGRATVTV